MCLLFWPFKNSDNLEFLKAYHAGLGEEICFFSSQKTHIIFVIVSINYSWVSQLDHRIVMSSFFDVRWKFDQIMSNQSKVFWGGWEITRKQIPAKTSPFHLWFEKSLLQVVWLHISLSGLTSLPASLLSGNHAAFLHHLASQHLHKNCNCLLSFSILF